jgi:type I restriction enzyme R subunit
VGARDEDLVTTLANRLVRLEKQITHKEHALFVEQAQGKTIAQVAKELLNAYNADTVEEIREKVEKEMPGAPPDAIQSAIRNAQSEMTERAAAPFTGGLNAFIENVRKTHEQMIDTVNPDMVEYAGWQEHSKENAMALVKDFAAWIEAHKNEITALQIFYDQPFRRRELTYAMVRELVEVLSADKPTLAPLRVWQAYEQLEQVNGSTKNELIALVSLVRHVCGIDKALTSYDRTVDKNFQAWAFKKQAGALKLTEEQMQWLRMIKDYVATSFHIERDDFDLSPFNGEGGLGKMWQLFGEQTDKIIQELNEALAA